jgi:hypothetical protein
MPGVLTAYRLVLARTGGSRRWLSWRKSPTSILSHICKGVSFELLLQPAFLEQHVLRANPAFPAILQVQIAITARDVVAAGESEQAGSPIDPSRRPFELEEVPNRRLIQQHFAETMGFGIFGAVFLVPKNGMKAHVRKDRLQASIVGQIEFNLLALLVSAGLGWPFVGEHTVTARESNTNDHAVLAQTALGIIEKDIRFQCAGLGHAEAELAESPPDFCKLA